MENVSNNISEAANLLRLNQVVAIPTETVYGLAANIFNDAAIQKIFSLKKRPHFNPLIVHVGRIQDITSVATDIPDMAWELIQNFWPGPLTLLLPKRSIVSDLITAGKSRVAVRMPAHSLTLKLLQQLNFPLAAPSANPFNRISPTSAKHVYQYFKNEIPLILDGGNCTEGLESTIIGFDEGKAVLYRHGSIALEEIEKIIGTVEIHQNLSQKNVVAPGMLSKHYSPLTPFFVCENIDQEQSKWEGKKVGFLTLKPNPNLSDKNFYLSKKGDLKEAAANLFATMHQLDQMELDAIVCELMPNIDLGRSMNDRLKRAAYFDKKTNKNL